MHKQFKHISSEESGQLLLIFEQNIWTIYMYVLCKQ